MTSILKTIFLFFRASIKRYSTSDGSRMGAAFAFYSIFSIVPLIIITLAVVSAIFGYRVAEEQTFNTMKEQMGPAVAETLQKLVANSRKTAESITATIIGTTLVLWGASKFFIELRKGMNDIWHVDENVKRGFRSLVKDRMVALGLTFLGGAVMLTSVALSTVVQVARRMAEQVGAGGWAIDLAATKGVPLVTLVILFVLFAFMFKMVPAAKIRWCDVWLAAIVTALLFTVGKFVIGLYLARTTKLSVYGAAGSLVVIMMWVYYTSQIVIFGSAMTAVYSERYGSRKHDALKEKMQPQAPDQLYRKAGGGRRKNRPVPPG
ncbi:hypothetical protein CVU37_06765 [candidate division BRC1 bacterium HGW-BRC1-1]|jgi:membrane protein|nr:MAG: hypothetical protein CVU37_06765 [candidate division BRC1 bacterium HGW-BRC1-1]